MEDWTQLALGQGGALFIMLWGGRIGFKFLTDMIAKQEARSDIKNKKFDELQKATLEHIAAHTKAVENLSTKIEDQIKFCEMKKAVNG